MRRRSSEPPVAARWVLKWFIPQGISGSSMLGDLREEYLRHARSGSPRAAALSYWKASISIVFHFLGSPWKQPGRVGPLKRTRHLIESLAFELRVAIRSLRQRPVFAAAVVGTLGLAIAANTVVFSIVNGVLIKPLPYPEGERLVGVFRLIPSLMGQNPTNARVSGWFAVPYALYLDWTEHGSVLESCGAYAPSMMTVLQNDEPQRMPGAFVTSGVFSALGISPLLGSSLVPADDRPGQPARIVLSHGFWQRHFGGDPTVLGRPLLVDGTSYDIAGVMPREFRFPNGDTQLWATFSDERKTLSYRKGGYLQVIARLKPGVSIRQAQVEMEELHRRIAEEHPEDREFGVRLISRHEMVGAPARPGLLLLLGAVGTVLLIACANIANLTLARITQRRREVGLRQALGEGRGRLLARVWLESLLLSLWGGVIGIVLAAAGLRTVIAAFPTPIPRSDEITIDHTVWIYVLGLSLGAGLLIGLLPALRWSSSSVLDSLLHAGRSVSGGRHRHRVHSLLVAVEVALAFVLLTSAGLFVRSLSGLMAVNPGLVADNILTGRVVLPRSGTDSPEKIRASFQELAEKVGAVAGVEAVGGATQMPFVGGLSFPPTTVEGASGNAEAAIHCAAVTPSFFRILGVPLLLGRPFTEDDRRGTLPVAIVNETLTRRYWPDQNPIGRRVRIRGVDETPWLQVVGVVRDFRYSLAEPEFPAVYLPFSQAPQTSQYLIVKTGISPERVSEALRHVLRGVDRQRAVQISQLREVIQRSEVLINSRFVIIVLGSLAGAAALLAVLGIYGVLAYTVTQRNREIGIRMALGAGRAAVVRSVLARGLSMTGIGLAAGLVGSLAVSGLLKSLLFGIDPADPATLATVAMMIVAAATIAGYLPARRATRIEPVAALRCE